MSDKVNIFTMTRGKLQRVALEAIADNRKLKAALGHANAALDGFGEVTELVKALEYIQSTMSEDMDVVSGHEEYECHANSLLVDLIAKHKGSL